MRQYYCSITGNNLSTFYCSTRASVSVRLLIKQVLKPQPKKAQSNSSGRETFLYIDSPFVFTVYFSITKHLKVIISQHRFTISMWSNFEERKYKYIFEYGHTEHWHRYLLCTCLPIVDVQYTSWITIGFGQTTSK